MKFLYLTIIVSFMVTACVKPAGKPENDIVSAKIRDNIVLKEEHKVEQDNNALNIQENIDNQEPSDAATDEEMLLSECEYLSKISGNIVLMGQVAGENGKIYYSNNRASTIDYVNDDGSNKQTLVSDVRAGNLLYYKGKIYFENFDEENRKSRFCSINEDGTDYQIIIDEIVNTTYIYDDIIYYKDGSYRFHSYDINTKEDTLIKEPWVAGSVVYKDKLYYYDNWLSGNILEYDMTNKTEVWHDAYVSSYMQFFKEKLYFNTVRFFSQTEGAAFLAEFDIKTGELTQCINTSEYMLDMDFFIVKDEYVFFIGRKGKEGGGIDETVPNALYRIDRDGSNLIKLYENGVEAFFIVDDKIFVTNTWEHYRQSDDSYMEAIDFEGKSLGWDL